MTLSQKQIIFLDNACGKNEWKLNPKTGLVDVKGDVYCNRIGLTKLPVAFGTVGSDFWCGNNQLTSLAGCPQTVGGGFYCDGNQLTSLAGCPQTVSGDFYCGNNPFDPTPELIATMKKFKCDEELKELRKNLYKYYGLSKDNPILKKIWKELNKDEK